MAHITCPCTLGRTNLPINRHTCACHPAGTGQGWEQTGLVPTARCDGRPVCQLAAMAGSTFASFGDRQPSYGSAYGLRCGVQGHCPCPSARGLSKTVGVWCVCVQRQTAGHSPSCAPRVVSWPLPQPSCAAHLVGGLPGKACTLTFMGVGEPDVGGSRVRGAVGLLCWGRRWARVRWGRGSEAASQETAHEWGSSRAAHKAATACGQSGGKQGLAGNPMDTRSEPSPQAPASKLGGWWVHRPVLVAARSPAGVWAGLWPRDFWGSSSILKDYPGPPAVWPPLPRPQLLPPPVPMVTPAGRTSSAAWPGGWSGPPAPLELPGTCHLHARALSLAGTIQGQAVVLGG